MRYKIQHTKFKLQKRTRRFALIFSLPIFCLLGLALFFSLRLASRTQAVWVDENWQYRTTLSFTHNASVSDTKVKIEIDTATLISAGKMQSDCGDSRFTDLNGKQLLYYMNAGGGAGVGCNDASTDYYVLVPSIISGSNVLYHYYGNPSSINGTQSSQFSQSTTTPSGVTISTGSQETSSGPLAYWPLDEGTGTTTYEKGPKQSNGTLTNGALWGTSDGCLSGKCIVFDGSNDTVAIGDISSLNFERTDAFSASVWFKTTYTAPKTILSKMAGSAPYAGWNLQTGNTGYLYFQLTNTYNTNMIEVRTTNSTNFSDGQWHHFAVTYTGSSAASGVTLYFDGVPQAMTTVKNVLSSSIANSSSVQIGSRNNEDNYFVGSIDEPKVHTYVRTATQVKNEFASRGKSALGVSAQAGSNQSGISSGLVGYWKMDESSWGAPDCSTAVVRDASGSTNHANACPNTTGPTGGAAGKFGSAGSFDGTNDYIDALDKTDFEFGATNSEMTLSAWIYPSTISPAAAMTIMSKYNSTSNREYIFQMSTTGKLTLSLSGDGASVTSLSSTSTLTANTWQLVTVTFSAATGATRFYVNGALDKDGTIAVSPIFTGTALFEIGATNKSTTTPDLFWSGSLDEVRVYRRVLSPAEIASLYSFAPEPIGYWKFDDASGTSVADTSGNGYTATITDSTTVGSWTTGKFGKTYDMAGNDDTDVINLSSGVGIGTRNTLSLWVNFSTLGSNDFVIGGSSTGTAAGYMLYLDGTDIYSRQALASGVSVPGTFTNGTWYHLAVVRDGTSITFYKNGIQLGATQTYGSDNAFTLKTLTNFDTGATTFALEGKVDDVRLYNYARTPAQVIEDMNGGHPLGGSPIGSQVAYWDMDETNGTSAHDSSANAHDLTLSAASWTSSGKTNSAWNGLGTNWLSRADDDDLDFVAADSFAISMWAKSDSATNPAATEYLLYKAPSGVSNGGYGIYVNTSGQYCFGIDDDNTSFPEDSSCSTSDFYDGNWHHIVATKTGTTKIQIFVDTKPQTADSSLSATGTLANTSIIYLGDKDGINNADEYNGDLDEVKMYRSDLTADQLALEYNSGAAVNYGSTATTESTQITGSAETAPINYWNFDERTGTTAADKGTGAKNGTISGNTTWATGKIGSGLKLDGATGVISVGGFTPPAVMTFETWFYANSIGENSLGRIAEHTNFSLFMQTSTILFQSTWSTPGQWTIPLPSLSAWHHLIVVYDSGSSSNTPTIYVDGIAQTVTTAQAASGSITMSSATLRIGNTSGDNRTFDGTLDDTKIFNYARTQSQAAYDFNRGGPVGWWQFDECSGTTAHDTSGKGNTATMTFAGGTYTQAGSCTSGSASDAWYGGATGKFNSGIALDTTSDVIDIGNISTYAFERTNSFSVSIWFKTTNNTTMTLMAKQDSSSPFSGWTLELGNSGVINFILANSYSTNALEVRTPNTNYADGAWHHVIATYDGSSTAAGTHIYFDSKDQTLTAAFSSLTGSILNSIPVTIGSRNDTSQKYAGLLDDARIYNYTLTASQVRKLTTGGSAIQFAPSSGQP